MSWSLSLSGHLEGEDAADKEAALLADIETLVATHGGMGSFSGQYSGYQQIPAPAAAEDTSATSDTTEDAAPEPDPR